MSFQIIQNDITKVKVDAIVNSTNHLMIGFNGVDRLLHELGGKEFEEECRALKNYLYMGEAVSTHAFNVPANYIIHTYAPTWRGGIEGECAIIRSCYKTSLDLAADLGCKSVAFPLIGAGQMGCPITTALSEAVTTIREFLLNSDIDVYLVLFGDSVSEMAKLMFPELDSYIKESLSTPKFESLSDALQHKGKSFVEMLTGFIDEKGITDADCYNKAGIQRATFNKLINGGTKKPSLSTAIALAIALELNYEETCEFLASAGLALSQNSKFDLIISYYIKNQKYDIWEINCQLENYGQPILGQ